MQPLRNTKSIRFGRLKMYREDLDELVGLFQKSCALVTISDDKNSYDSLAEMKPGAPLLTLFEKWPATATAG